MTTYDVVLNNLKVEMRNHINNTIQETEEDDEGEITHLTTMRERVNAAVEIMQVVEVMRLSAWDVESAIATVLSAAGVEERRSDIAVLGGQWDT